MGVLADLILVTHFLYVLAVVLPLVLIPIGIRRGWPWVRSRPLRLLHGFMMGFVLFEIYVGMKCPLTEMEKALLAEAGRPGYEGSFISHLISHVMYLPLPYWVFVVVYSLVFSWIAFMWWKWPPVASNGEKSSQSPA